MRSVRRAMVPASPADPAHQADRHVAERGDEDDGERLGDRDSGTDDEQGENRQRRQRAMREQPLGQIVG